jgi:poly(beta-D-mannuronate) lyase
VRDIRLVEYYTDKAYSVVDEKRRKEADRSAEPLHRYARKVTFMADRALVQRQHRDAVTACLVRWLGEWADAGAMLGEIDGPLAQHYRKWTLASIALAYVAIKPGADIGARRKAAIEGWLRRLAGEMDAYYGSWRRESWNNHMYWQGLAEAAVAAAVDDRRLLEKAAEKYRHAVDALTPEGLLPKEVARAEKAYGYHAFSLAPLVLLAEIGERNGMALYALRGGAIHRLARVVVQGMEETAGFERLVGKRQDVDPRGKVWTLAWLEPYLARFPDPDLEKLLAPNRPVGHEWLGGNLTLHFAGLDAARGVTPAEPR